jgi:triosephosphate isomerase (TIM)
MARTPLLAGNWKMFGTLAETGALIRDLRAAVDGVTGRDVLVAPPFTALAAAAEALSGSRILLGGQNVHWEAKGAFTGEISAAMLLELGCRAAIIGHSERRQLFGETDAGVNRRTKAALAAGLLPIVCVGETLAEREGGETLTVVERQLRGALLDLGEAGIRGVSIAYEPVWAIGTGKTATPDQAQEVHASIRKVVDALADRGTAEAVRILYGGSVKPDNIDELMKQADIDGALVGGASLDAKSFARIVEFRV